MNKKRTSAKPLVDHSVMVQKTTMADFVQQLEVEARNNGNVPSGAVKPQQASGTYTSTYIYGPVEEPYN